MLTRCCHWWGGRSSLCEQHIWTEEDSQDSALTGNTAELAGARRHLSVLEQPVEGRSRQQSELWGGG